MAEIAVGLLLFFLCQKTFPLRMVTLSLPDTTTVWFVFSTNRDLIFTNQAPPKFGVYTAPGNQRRFWCVLQFLQLEADVVTTFQTVKKVDHLEGKDE